jgi:acyl-CoA thioester hydrolase
MGADAPRKPESRHVYALRVYFEDTDAGGIVYYANYLKFAERARTELMRALGASHVDLMENDRVMMTVRSCDAEFLAPARLDEVLEVHTTVEEVRGASLRLVQTVRRGLQDLVRLRIRLACVGDDMRPAPLPERLRTALAASSSDSRRG